jgi:hypothetical protein
VARCSDNRAVFFQYYVFGSQTEQFTSAEQGAGVYLMEPADSQHLRKFFDPLYDSVGIGISTGDDELIGGGTKLAALAQAVADAIADVRKQPEHWPMLIGYRPPPLGRERGAPIIEQASQSRLLEFLARVAEMTERARATDGFVQFGGGG